MADDKIEPTGAGSRLVASYTPKLMSQDEKNTLPYVRDFVDYGVVRLRRDMPVYRAVEVLLDKKVTGAAVVDEDDTIVGILSEKDCLQTFFRAAYENLPGSTVEDYMSKDVQTITLDMDIMSVVAMFLHNVYRRLLVADAEGKLLGQVTRRDLLRVFRKMLRDKKHGSYF